MLAFENVCVVFLIYIFTYLTDPVSCGHNEPISFTLKTVSELTLTKDPEFVVHFSWAEERQKLCSFAKNAADLAYVDYNNNFVPTWHAIDSEEFAYGMYCASLPTVYIVREPFNPVLQITFIQSAIDQYEFNENIILAKSAHPTSGDQDEIAEKSDWMKLGAEDRKNLCNAARKYLSPLHFVDHNVDSARPHIFEYLAPNKPETHDAFPCPTVPQLYLRRGSVEKKVEIVRLRSFLDDYEFEMEKTNPKLTQPSDDRTHIHAQNGLTQLNLEERKSLCIIARRYYAYSMTHDSDVPEAQLYSFQYGSEQPEVHNMTIRCPALPHMYLRSDISETIDKKTKIFITFVQTPADQYSYVSEVVISAYRINDTGEREEAVKAQLKEHSFAKLSTEDAWNLCSAAQKHIHSDKGGNVHFIFAENNGIFSNPKVLLIPAHVNSAQMYEVERLNKERETDALIKCSEWPRMYLRRGGSEKEIKIVLMKYELKGSPSESRNCEEIENNLL